MTDEHLLTAAKIREQLHGRIEGGETLHDHAGLITDPKQRSVLSMVADATGDDLTSNALGSTIRKNLATDALTEALVNGNMGVVSRYVGVTEQNLEASSVTLSIILDSHLDNNDAPAFITGVGNPNAGKTNLVALIEELRSFSVPDLLTISNIRSWSRTDLVATSAHDLATTLLEHRDQPKMIVVDEGSTHFDARTNRYEVASQWTPLAKRFAKMGVDCCAVVGHTGKDLHPELKRLTTLGFVKHSKKEVSFYSSWNSEADRPHDPIFAGKVSELQPATEEPNPDDAAPWAWNLQADIFAADLDWSELLEKLYEEGPAND